MCPKNSTTVLKSAENYHYWDMSIRSTLSTFGSGLLEFYEDGDLLVPPDNSPEDPSIVQLSHYMNRALQVILVQTVDAEIISSYQSEGLFGSTLLTAIRRDHSTLFARQLAKLVDNFSKVSSMQPPQALKVLKTLRAQFAHGMSIDQLLGLIYLKTFNNTSAESRILDAATPRLELSAIEASLRDITTTSQALVSTSKKSGKGNKKLICVRCQAPGHKSPQCTAPAPVAPSSSTNRTEDKTSKNLSWCAARSWFQNDDMYTLDSGSTLHVSKNISHFLDYTPDPSGGNVSGISDGSLNILGYGTVLFDNNGSTIKVSNVAYVPQATRNLLSISSVSRSSGSRFTFDGDSCYLDDGTKIGEFMSDTLYQFLPVPRVMNHISLSTVANMHSKLGHPSPQIMKAMGFTAPDDVELCPHCCAGKMTKTFPKLSTTKTSASLQLLHVDLCGIISVAGISGERHFLTIVDDFTRWCSIVPLNTKAQTATALKDFVSKAENHFSSKGFKVAAVRSDNGKEFCNNQLKDYFTDKGIVHQLTVPHNSSQNGVAERKHRTVQEKARTLLHESGLSDKFWSEAVKTAEFLVNRYPTRVLQGISPFSLWYGHSPDYSVMHSFGCHCMVLIPPEKRSNIFSPVSVAGIFVGYSPSHKAYRIFVPQVNDIFVSNNVRFDDSKFPLLNPDNHIFQSGSMGATTASDIFFGGSAGGIPALRSALASPAVSEPYVPSGHSSSTSSTSRPASSSGISMDSSSTSSGRASVISVSSGSDTADVPSSTGSDHADVSIGDQDGTESGSEYVDSDYIQPFGDAGGFFNYVGLEDDISIHSTGSAASAGSAAHDDLTFPVYDEVEHLSPGNVSPSDVTSMVRATPDTPPKLIPLNRSLSQISNTSVVYPHAKRPQIDYNEIAFTPLEHVLLADPTAETDTTTALPNSERPTPIAPPSLLPLQRSLSQVSASSTDYPVSKRFQAVPPEKALFLSRNAIAYAFSVVLTSSAPASIPVTYHDVLSHPERSSWLAAIDIELQAHSNNHTWDFVKLPAGRRAIGCRWVFTIKDSTSPPTYKARLVAQGFRQIYGLDYFETFSPVVRYESIRIVLALAAQFGLTIHQMDVTTAFLNGHLDEEIYMKVPDGVSASNDVVCKLNKSLYGLKQAPLCWNTAINKVLLSAGFQRSINEFGIYTKVSGSSILIVALYVDDLLICSNNPGDIQAVKHLLSSHYKMKDLGVASRFLGMELEQTSSTVGLHLSHYLTQFLMEFNMQDCNPVTTPFAAGTEFLPGKPISDADSSRFRSM
ncbi:hypothetical protein CANINC_000822, partial [Pichia inconspicua]